MDEKSHAQGTTGAVESDAGRSPKDLAAPQAARSDGMTDDGVEPRRWVLIAGGAMTLGWLILIISILAGSANAAFLALIVMIPVAIWWRFKTRDLAAEAAKRERSWSRKAALDIGVAIGDSVGKPGRVEPDRDEQTGKIAKIQSGVTKQQLKAQSWRDADTTPTITDWLARKHLSFVMRIYGSVFAVFKGFFTLIPAALAEWRATHRTRPGR